ncbi:MAG: MFS transporter [Betaproteobacteria bacterium]|nr:MFS transporter [Betaproteobacteria bacterium]
MSVSETSAAAEGKAAAGEKKNIAVLGALQALLFINNTTAIVMNGLAGYALASDKALATLPVTAWVVGGALSTYPASMLMKRIGRSGGFTVGALIGMLGAAICALAIYLANFWLLCLGTMVFGVYNAFGQYYRFAAADASRPAFKARAISLVLIGGLVGGIVGPELSNWTVALLSTRFLGSYLSLLVFLTIVILVIQLIDIPKPTEAEHNEPARPLPEIMMQPAVLAAVLASAVAYGVMNLLMTATPLAMSVCGHPYSAAATVISWHVIGMFGPSFFTGSLIKRFGVVNVMFAGVALLVACCITALSGITVAHFWWSMFFVGVGWNFLYIGGTTLLTDNCSPSERAKTQGANDTCIFFTLAFSSIFSGMLLEKNGWETLNYVALPLASVALGTVFWLMLKRRAPVPLHG